jgi:N-terminal domain of anti-restriction factor ArdC
MTVKQRMQLTDQERAERRERDREYARQAVQRLRSSEGWRAWLTTRATFHGYCLPNQLLIAIAMPSATRVAGFKAWLKLGYCVSRGETAIRIWAPYPPSRRQLERWKQNGADPDQRPRTFFKLTAVLDRLSRVRSGEVRDVEADHVAVVPRCQADVRGRRRPRRARLPPGISLLFVRAPAFVRGAGLSACAVVAELAPGGRRRSGCAGYGC